MSKLQLMKPGTIQKSSLVANQNKATSGVKKPGPMKAFVPAATGKENSRQGTSLFWLLIWKENADNYLRFSSLDALEFRAVPVKYRYQGGRQWKKVWGWVGGGGAGLQKTITSVGGHIQDWSTGLEKNY